MNGKDFLEKQRKFKRFFSTLPRYVGVRYIAFIERNFDNESFGKDGEQWRARKQDPEGKSPRRERRALLVASSRLKNSFDYQVNGNMVSIGSDVPYAQRHNEGIKGTPERQFIGPSDEFDQELQDYVEDKLDEIFG